MKYQVVKPDQFARELHKTTRKHTQNSVLAIRNSGREEIIMKSKTIYASKILKARLIEELNTYSI